jgi:hypothetical protein
MDLKDAIYGRRAVRDYWHGDYPSGHLPVDRQSRSS